MSSIALTSTKVRQAIGQRLRTERERMRFQPLQIAQLLGVPLDQYLAMEAGQQDISSFALSRLSSSGFDVLFILTDERHRPVQEESELLQRFRELSLRGRTTIFTTLDALERLAPNIKAFRS